MAIAFHCPHCDHFYRVKADFAGEVWGCRACAGAMQIPHAFDADLDTHLDEDDMLPVEALVMPEPQTQAASTERRPQAQNWEEQEPSPFDASKSGSAPLIAAQRPSAHRPGPFPQNGNAQQSPWANPNYGMWAQPKSAINDGGARAALMLIGAFLAYPLAEPNIGYFIAIAIFVRALLDLKEMQAGVRSSAQRSLTIFALVVALPMTLASIFLALVYLSEH